MIVIGIIFGPCVTTAILAAILGCYDRYFDELREIFPSATINPERPINSTIAAAPETEEAAQIEVNNRRLSGFSLPTSLESRSLRGSNEEESTRECPICTADKIIYSEYAKRPITDICTSTCAEIGRASCRKECA